MTAIYDAVNAIDRTHAVYMVRVAGGPRSASEDAAAALAAHDVLVALYPAFKHMLDAQLQQSLAQMSRRGDPSGIRIGQAVAERILALRSHDCSNALEPGAAGALKEHGREAQSIAGCMSRADPAMSDGHAERPGRWS